MPLGQEGRILFEYWNYPSQRKTELEMLITFNVTYCLRLKDLTEAPHDSHVPKVVESAFGRHLESPASKGYH